MASPNVKKVATGGSHRLAKQFDTSASIQLHEYKAIGLRIDQATQGSHRRLQFTRCHPALVERALPTDRRALQEPQGLAASSMDRDIVANKEEVS